MAKWPPFGAAIFVSGVVVVLQEEAGLLDVELDEARTRLVRRQVAGDSPTARLNARENAASLS